MNSFTCMHTIITFMHMHTHSPLRAHASTYTRTCMHALKRAPCTYITIERSLIVFHHNLIAFCSLNQAAGGCLHAYKGEPTYEKQSHTLGVLVTRVDKCQSRKKHTRWSLIIPLVVGCVFVLIVIVVVLALVAKKAGWGPRSVWREENGKCS